MSKDLVSTVSSNASAKDLPKGTWRDYSAGLTEAGILMPTRLLGAGMLATISPSLGNDLFKDTELSYAPRTEMEKLGQSHGATACGVTLGLAISAGILYASYKLAKAMPADNWGFWG